MTTLRELGLLFLRLGTTAFGGPAAHIAMMQDEVVRRRSWLTQQDFLDLLGATNLIPGPNSTEMAIHIGHRRRGWPGLLVAGTCFIIPAALIVGVAAYFYVSYGSVPKVKGILYGVKPAIIAVIFQALHSLGRTALKNRGLAIVAIASVGAVLVGVHELVVLGSAGLLAMLRTSPVRLGQMFCEVSGLSLSPILMLSTATYVKPFAIWPLFAFFVKVGSVLFGSGYVLLAFLRADLVERWHWLTEAQLLDAIAVGQVTPGPVFTTATFIGYLLGGATGAIVATFGIFAPAFVFVAISGPLVPRIRQSVWAGAFLDGVNAASLALMAVVTVQLGRSALIDWLTIAIAALSMLSLVRYGVNSVYLVIGGGLIGLSASVIS
jgi:chromate transporter